MKARSLGVKNWKSVPVTLGGQQTDRGVDRRFVETSGNLRLLGLRGHSSVQDDVDAR